MNRLLLEQMELLRDAKIVESINNIDIVAIPKNWLDALLSSEKAWREENELNWVNARHWEVEYDKAKIAIEQRDRTLNEWRESMDTSESLVETVKQLSEKLNQAVEVLKICALPYDDFCGSCDQAVRLDGDPTAIKFLKTLGIEVSI